jgi:hypothetical protein
MKRLSPQLAADSVLALLKRSTQNTTAHAPAALASVTRLPLAWFDETGEPLGTFQR